MPWVSDVIDRTLSGIVGSLATIAAGFLVFRRRLSSDNTVIASDKTQRWLIDTLRTEISNLIAQRDAASQAAKEAVDIRIADASTIATLRAELAGCEVRNSECQEQASRSDARAAAAEERARVQSEQLLIAHMHAETVYAELARKDPESASKLSARRYQSATKQAGPT